MDNGAGSYHRFLQGDESAFDEILDMYRENLIFFINRFVHNITVAEDLAADVFVEIIVHKNRYNHKSSFKTYLFMIGRSRAIDYLRREKKFKNADIADIEGEADDIRTLEETLIINEEKLIISRAMDKLKDDYKTVLHLVYFEDMSNSEAAKAMKKSNKQIENLLYRAKQAMREILGKEYDWK